MTSTIKLVNKIAPGFYSCDVCELQTGIPLYTVATVARLGRVWHTRINNRPEKFKTLAAALTAIDKAY